MKYLLVSLLLLFCTSVFSQGLWVSGYKYLTYDRVFLVAGGTVYESLTSHTSSSVNAPPNAVSWRVFNSSVSGAPSSNMSYLGSVPSTVNLGVDYSVLSWLFLAGLGAGLLSKLFAMGIYRALNSR
jgi:hypothetical protein